MGAISTVKDVVSELFGVDVGVARLTTKLDELATRARDLATERDALLTQAPIRADAADTVPALIAARRQHLGAERPELLDLPAHFAGSLFVDSAGLLIRHAPRLPDGLLALPAFDLAVLLDPAGLAEHLLLLVPVGEPGARTIPERVARLAAIDAERARVLAEHAALVDRAGTLGVTVGHLAETIAARRRAANERERAERQAETDRRAQRYGQ